MLSRFFSDCQSPVVEPLDVTQQVQWRRLFRRRSFWSRSLAKWVLIASVSRRRNSAFCWVSTLAARGSPVMKTEAAERRFARTASNAAATSWVASGEVRLPV